MITEPTYLAHMPEWVDARHIELSQAALDCFHARDETPSESIAQAFHDIGAAYLDHARALTQEFEYGD